MLSIINLSQTLHAVLLVIRKDFYLWCEKTAAQKCQQWTWCHHTVGSLLIDVKMFNPEHQGSPHQGIRSYFMVMIILRIRSYNDPQRNENKRDFFFFFFLCLPNALLESLKICQNSIQCWTQYNNVRFHTAVNATANPTHQGLATGRPQYQSRLDYPHHEEIFSWTT